MRHASLALLPLAAVTLACAGAPTSPDASPSHLDGRLAVTAAAAGPSVTGGGTITFGESVEHVSVNVAGASGHAVFHDNAAGGNVTGQIDITCVNVVGNVATLGGTVTRSNRSELEGFEALFQIVDNGEGSGTSDFMSPVLLHAPGTTEATCLVPGELDLAPVKGNFQVTP